MLSEAEYLTLQATRAKARFRQTVHTLTDEILGPLEIRPLIRRHPWWSLGGGALAGLVSGVGLGGRRRRHADGPTADKSSSTVAQAGRSVRRMLSAVVSALVVANLRGGAATPVEPSSNGHSTEP